MNAVDLDFGLVVPTSATMYAQVVNSSLAAQWRALSGANLRIKTPEVSTASSLALHDLQLTQMPENSFKAITEPVEIFK